MQKEIIKVDKTKLHSAQEAAELLKQVSTTKFTGSVDIDIVLNVTEKQKKDVISGSTTLPHQVGQAVRVAVITSGENQEIAKKAGADLVGMKEIIEDISKGKLDFDVLIATAEAMPQLARHGKILGPRGLMPSPKNETVTTDVAKTVASYKAGKLNFKSSDQSAIRARVGKLDMTAEQIAENISSFVAAVYEEAKKLGSQPFKKITVSPTMGQGVRLDVTSVLSV
jgi:large subunit ribosomal protein L1